MVMDTLTVSGCSLKKESLLRVTVRRAGDAIHPALRKRAVSGFETKSMYTLYTSAN